MKTSIEIPRLLIISVVLMFISLWLIVKNGHNLYYYNHPYELDGMTETMMKKGKYVNCNIDNYLVKKVESNRYTGQSETFITFGKEYNTYTVPLASNDYIRIMVYSKDTVEKLEAFSRGKGENVEIKGMIINGQEITDDSWYRDIEDFDFNCIVQDYVIQEKSDEGIQNGLIVGILLLDIAVFLWWKSGGIKKKILLD